MNHKKIIPVIRRCLIGIMVAAALVEVLLGVLFIGGVQHGFFTIWFVPLVLLIMAAEQLLRSDNTRLDYIWIAFTAVAAIHVVLAMILHLNHAHDDAVLCSVCGMLTLAWYVIPWIVLSMLRLRAPDKNLGILCGCIALVLIASVCLMHGFVSRFLILDGATYGFLICVFVKLGSAFVCLLRDPFD